MEKRQKEELKFEAKQEEAKLDAQNKASQKYNLEKDFESWLNEYWVQYKLNQFLMFPNYVDLARIQNAELRKEMQEFGYKGKYSNSYGWSKDGTMRFDYDIPNDLYMWMKNLVDDKFWSNDNSKVWRTFMHRICRGDKAWEIFLWIKKLYGLDPEEKLKKLQKKQSIAMGGKIIGPNDPQPKSKIIKPTDSI